jgi:thiamine biosynthesis lipoprotein
VNAGGDLRVFGAAATTIHVRHPGDPGRIAPLLRLANGAIATSAVYSSRRRWRGRWVSPLVDPVRGRSCLRRGSASVRTALCIDADALTKVLMILGRRAAEVLRAHGAEGYLISATGELTQMGDVR